MIRRPAVAGRFYPASTDKLTEVLESFLRPEAPKMRAIGIIVPHAGYLYSGHVAGEVYSQIEMPSRYVILCPNHTGRGAPISMMMTGAWETPLGNLPVDEEMAEAIQTHDRGVDDDVLAHQYEHAIEVQLPFIRYLRPADCRFVPIAVGTGRPQQLHDLGLAIASAIQKIDRSTLIVASSDMNHYESDRITRIKDRKAIDRVLELNPAGLYETVKTEDISMCGYGPAVAMLTATRQLGAAEARLVKYATSGDVSGDYSSVVGYAGIVVA